MIRGTTPTITFTLPMEIAFDTLYITFVQNEVSVLEKTLSDVAIDGTTVVLPLSQADTLAFSSDSNLWIQLRGKVGNIAYASNIIKTPVGAILKAGEI